MGGRRRSSVNKPVAKKRPKLDKVFKCPSCSHDGCTVVMSKGDKGPMAIISCKVCKDSHRYRKKVTYLTEPVDVFADWIDYRAERIKQAAKRQRSVGSPEKREEIRESRNVGSSDGEEEFEMMNVPSVRRKTSASNDNKEDLEERDDEDQENEESEGSESEEEVESETDE